MKFTFIKNSMIKLDSLHAIKMLHTVIWAFFAACIVTIPIAAYAGKLTVAFALIGIVFVEVMVIVFNSWACPLTAVAARHTDDRRDNFDIYLPEWLARYNKTIFGTLYFAGIVMTVMAWLR
ncbi:MAG: hypothetical protein KF749_07225 [Bacteroidetes bacterium]|nr:hypothetical protein [Bacteroidota bacterium]MCW5896563.1 hypothetical protein [Bacteroidota bacterium]